ncbi:MAG: flavin reductase family protein [Candidatus Velthaea sp.]
MGHAPHAAAIACVASNVVIVTTAGAFGIHGSTANVWCEPAERPYAFIVLDPAHETYAHVTDSRVFAVNILGAGSESVALQFAGPQSDRFRSIDYKPGVTGAPLLDCAIAVLECELHREMLVEAHAVLAGAVVASRLGTKRRPLTYVDGTFG